MPVSKDEFVQKMKAQLDDLNDRWNVERSKLEAKALEATGEAKKKLEQEREDLRTLRKEMKSKIVDLDVAGENAFYELKDGAEDAWKSLSDAFKKAVAQFK